MTDELRKRAEEIWKEANRFVNPVDMLFDALLRVRKETLEEKNEGSLNVPPPSEPGIMSEPSKTPRTDMAEYLANDPSNGAADLVVKSFIARQLESELSQCRERAEAAERSLRDLERRLDAMPLTEPPI